MDPLPSTSQAATTSTSAESDSNLRHLRHMPTHDVFNFGMPCELSGLNLPTKQDILRYYFYLAERAKAQNKMFSHKTFTPNVADKLVEIWNKLDAGIAEKLSIVKKLNIFVDKYKIENKHKIQEPSFIAFVQSTKELFYIGKCKCDLKTALCSCGLIPEPVLATNTKYSYSFVLVRSLGIPRTNE